MKFTRQFRLERAVHGKVWHRLRHGIQQGKPLLAILGALERIGLGLVRHPQVVKRNSAWIRGNDPSWRSVMAAHDLIDWTTQQQPFLFGQGHGAGLICASKRAGT